MWVIDDDAVLRPDDRRVLRRTASTTPRGPSCRRSCEHRQRRGAPRAGWCRCRPSRSRARGGDASAAPCTCAGVDGAQRRHVLERVGLAMRSARRAFVRWPAASGSRRVGAAGQPRPQAQKLAQHGDDLARRCVRRRISNGDSAGFSGSASRGRRRGPSRLTVASSSAGPGMQRGHDVAVASRPPASVITTRSPSRMPAPIIESPATRRREVVAVPEAKSRRAPRRSPRSARSPAIGVPAAIRPRTTVPVALASSVDRRHRPRLRRVLRGASPLLLEVRELGVDAMRTTSDRPPRRSHGPWGVSALADGLRDDVQDALLAGE